jgi:iron complex transport system ATP-binding protein
MHSVILEAKGICFSYQDTSVLQDIDVKFSRAKFYGVLGPNGSGKSTLLDVLLGFKRPDKGRVFLNNKDIRKYKKIELARSIAYIPQSYEINFPFTVEEIVTMGRYPYIKRFSFPSKRDLEIVEDIEKQIDIYRFRHRLITELSGGETQRVMIARALAQEAMITLLDEPTSNLDIKHSLKLLGLLKQKVRKESKTVICVFHNINEASYFCDEILFLKEGKIIDFGPVEKVLKKENLERIFEVDATVYFEEELKCYQVVFTPHKKEVGDNML